MDVYVLEFMIDMIPDEWLLKKSYQKWVQKPTIHRDLVLLVKESVWYQDIEHMLVDMKIELLKSCRFFDIYRGKHIPKGHKSLGVHLVFQSPDRTLTDEEVDKEIDLILKTAAEKWDAVLRER